MRPCLYLHLTSFFFSFFFCYTGFHNFFRAHTKNGHNPRLFKVWHYGYVSRLSCIRSEIVFACFANGIFQGIITSPTNFSSQGASFSGSYALFVFTFFFRSCTMASCYQDLSSRTHLRIKVEIVVKERKVK